MNMAPETAAQALATVVAVSGILFVYLKCWRGVVTDWARDAVFKNREALFDLARAGRMSFSDPVYRDVRDGFNSSIRFAHEVTLLHVVVVLKTAGNHLSNATLARRVPRLAAATISDPDLRADVLRLVDRVDSTMLMLLLAKSPGLSALLLLRLLLPTIRVEMPSLRASKSSLRKKLQPYSDALQAEAVAS